ncbi:glutathione hydrolase 3-like [Forsythia ovata]|uniref:Glutathione hydrolase 3-like n=1 Tax=Forsythia ovata TaxID=205694 RepID=A0ABD1SN49_9LAMI
MGNKDIEFPLMGSDDFARRKRWSRALWLLLGIIFIAIAFVGLALQGDLKFLGVRNDGKYNERIQFTNSDIVESQKAVVAADDGRCSEIGISILKMGGHAVDATVATALCLGVGSRNYG